MHTLRCFVRFKCWIGGCCELAKVLKIDTSWANSFLEHNVDILLHMWFAQNWIEENEMKWNKTKQFNRWSVSKDAIYQDIWTQWMKYNKELFKCNEWETQNDNIRTRDLIKTTWPTITYID